MKRAVNSLHLFLGSFFLEILTRVYFFSALGAAPETEAQRPCYCVQVLSTPRYDLIFDSSFQKQV
jgi:hypothetical protein